MPPALDRHHDGCPPPVGAATDQEGGAPLWTMARGAQLELRLRHVAGQWPLQRLLACISRASGSGSRHPWPYARALQPPIVAAVAEDLQEAHCHVLLLRTVTVRPGGAGAASSLSSMRHCCCEHGLQHAAARGRHPLCRSRRILSLCDRRPHDRRRQPRHAGLSSEGLGPACKGSLSWSGEEHRSHSLRQSVSATRRATQPAPRRKGS
mmetsp:Transcript_23042/g.71837  ORF Transcript_23042/g.71837 Transcript_23042/m.71837 type:complete len:208 (+) Transcript_23042:116-739(+)